MKKALILFFLLCSSNVSQLAAHSIDWKLVRTIIAFEAGMFTAGYFAKQSYDKNEPERRKLFADRVVFFEELKKYYETPESLSDMNTHKFMFMTQCVDWWMKKLSPQAKKSLDFPTNWLINCKTVDDQKIVRDRIDLLVEELRKQDELFGSIGSVVGWGLLGGCAAAGLKLLVSEIMFQ